MQNKPEVKLLSDRLILREFLIKDALAIYNLNDNPKVLKFTGDSSFSSVQEAKRFIKNYDQYKKYGFGRWAVILKKTNTFIGWCGLKQHENGKIDLGFRFFEKEWNKGYATESAKLCLEFAIKNSLEKKLIGRVHKDNIASSKVLEKIGFIRTGKVECNGFNDAILFEYNPRLN